LTLIILYVSLEETLPKDGEPSLLDKWSKAEIALKSGFDLVIELPTIYSISSAENFAEGAIKILDSLNMPTTLSFGSECGDIKVLESIANILVSEPKEFVSLLNHELQTGVSYPKARENALLMYLNDIRTYANILSEPNNTLGIEYLKALKKYNSKIQPLTIKRVGSNYNSKLLNSEYPSATAIRQFLLKGGKLEKLNKLLPQDTINTLSEKFKYGQFVYGLNSYEKQIIYILRKMTIQEIANLPDVSEGLENKIKEAANSSATLEELIASIKSKRYTRSRINRILLYALLNFNKKDITNSYKTVPYIRVLGVNARGKILLSRLSHSNKKLQIITSVKRYMEKCNDKNIKAMLEKDFFATDVYTTAYDNNSKAGLDYTQKLIV